MSKVSIIIPIYNVKNYVRRTIESVINQTESDIEIILVDDGSTDGSGKICDKYAEKDDRITVIHKKNEGLSSARNKGTEVSSSPYIMYLDGDDYLRKDAVKCCIRAMKNFPADFIQYFYKEVSDEVRVNETIDTNILNDKIYQANTSSELFYNLYRLGGVAASGSTKFMRRELALQVPFESITHEDEMWCTRAFQKKLMVTYLPEELYYYVMRDDSIIHCNFNKNKLDIFKVSEERIKVLRRLGLDDLVSYEYRKLFHYIIHLYNEAKKFNDQISALEIYTFFENKKDEIKQYANLKGKFNLLFKLMYQKFSLINIYVMYWKMKGV